MLGDIFYFLGLLVFIVSIAKTVTYYKAVTIKEWVKAFKNVSKKTPVKKDFKSNDDFSIYNLSTSGEIMEFLFFLSGLLTGSWIIFAMILSLQILIGQLNKLKIFEKTIGFLFQTTKAFTIVLLIINHYHLHLDLITFLCPW